MSLKFLAAAAALIAVVACVALASDIDEHDDDFDVDASPSKKKNTTGLGVYIFPFDDTCHGWTTPAVVLKIGKCVNASKTSGAPAYKITLKGQVATMNTYNSNSCSQSSLRNSRIYALGSCVFEGGKTSKMVKLVTVKPPPKKKTSTVTIKSYPFSNKCSGFSSTDKFKVNKCLKANKTSGAPAMKVTLNQRKTKATFVTYNGSQCVSSAIRNTRVYAVNTCVVEKGNNSKKVTVSGSNPKPKPTTKTVITIKTFPLSTKCKGVKAETTFTAGKCVKANATKGTRTMKATYNATSLKATFTTYNGTKCTRAAIRNVETLKTNVCIASTMSSKAVYAKKTAVKDFEMEEIEDEDEDDEDEEIDA